MTVAEGEAALPVEVLMLPVEEPAVAGEVELDPVEEEPLRRRIPSS